LIATVGTVAVMASPTHAATVEECQLLLSDLRQDTVEAADSFADAHTVGRLLIKLDDASTKLTESKNAEAVGKLIGYQTTLTQLATAAKPKVDPTTGATLTTQAEGVIGCILALG
jgi:hypothetical protein